MKNFLKYIVKSAALGLAILLFSGCSLFSSLFNGEKEFVLDTGFEKIQLTLEIADSSDERAKGLMEREELGENRGMWFVFEDEAVRNFWMKNTKIPLDVIFFDKDKKVVGLVKNMQPCPEAETQCPRYSSEVPAMYALEAQSGFAENNAVQIGDVITES